MTGYDPLGLYWGDLHVHVREIRRERESSGLPGAAGPFSLEEVYAYGREVTGLDFVAVTDHDVSLCPDEWEATREAARRETVVGSFAAFLGYEWSHVAGQPSCGYGHRNVIYREFEGPLLSCGAEAYDTAPKLWQGLREQVALENAVVVPHHPGRAAGGISWNLDCWDPELERLVEIYSLWGSSEKPGPPFEIRYLAEHSPTGRGEAPGHFVQDALARGHRFGLIGGSESHDGRPGGPLWHGPHRCGEEICYRGGLQATYAASLDHDSLFDAFRARRCYATTGEKIRLAFSLNGALMGEELAGAERRRVTVEVAGTDALARVEVIRNNVEAHVVDPGSDTCRFEWEDLRPAEDADYYYVRVTQGDGHMAWSSPVWVG